MMSNNESNSAVTADSIAALGDEFTACCNRYLSAAAAVTDLEKVLSGLNQAISAMDLQHSAAMAKLQEINFMFALKETAFIPRLLNVDHEYRRLLSAVRELEWSDELPLAATNGGIEAAVAVGRRIIELRASMQELNRAAVKHCEEANELGPEELLRRAEQLRAQTLADVDDLRTRLGAAREYVEDTRVELDRAKTGKRAAISQLRQVVLLMCT